jgi:hypothetical protein
LPAAKNSAKQAAELKMPILLRKDRSGVGTGWIWDFYKQATLDFCLCWQRACIGKPYSDGPFPVIVKTSKIMGLLYVLLFGSTLIATSADESQAAICSDKVRKFVKVMDALLSENPNNVLAFDYPIKKYLSVKSCNVDEVISISKSSRFFSELFEQDTEYSVVFGNKDFIASFALKKKTGNIEVPNARIRLPSPN